MRGVPARAGESADIALALALCVPAFSIGAAGCIATGNGLLAICCAALALAAGFGAWVEWRIARRPRRRDAMIKQRNVISRRAFFTGS